MKEGITRKRSEGGMVINNRNRREATYKKKNNDKRGKYKSKSDSGERKEKWITKNKLKKTNTWMT